MKNQRIKIFAVLLVVTTIALSFNFYSSSGQADELPLDKIKLPDGFKIAIYANVPNARSMVLSESGTLFVGNRNEDNVYAVQDTDGDMVADKTYIIDKDGVIQDILNGTKAARPTGREIFKSFQTVTENKTN